MKLSLRLAVACALGAPLAQAGTPASDPAPSISGALARQDGPPTAEDRLRRLEEENAALRARIDEIAAALERSQGQGDAGRIAELEAENAELERRIDAVAAELERFSLGSIAPPVGDSVYGFGPAASKVYAQDSGLSIGGYGELLYQNFAGSSPADQFDLLRSILYFGYKFDERWIFNSEIEYEHADTGSGGSVSVEFAYIDHLYLAELNFRAGLLLVPMGFVNELHEPVTFLSANRPMTESVLIPSTWRENGAGIFGTVGDVSYRTYVLNGFDASGFGAGGLRGGRQKGSRALAEDLAWVGRVDWEPGPGITLGASSYFGDSGQDQMLPGGPLGDTTTRIHEVHGEYRGHGLHLRALGAMADLDDVAQLNTALGLAGAASVGEELEGWYAEAGFDVLTLLSEDTGQSLTPFVRLEAYDTQAKVPAGFSAAPANDEELLTFGLNWKPLRQIVFKLDYIDADRGTDRWNAAVGYVF